MNPELLTTQEWNTIGATLIYVALFTVLAVISALSFLLGKAAIQSLVSSHELPDRFSKVRFPFYAVSLIALAGAGYVFFALVASGAFDVLSDFYSRFLI